MFGLTKRAVEHHEAGRHKFIEYEPQSSKDWFRWYMTKHFRCEKCGSLIIKNFGNGGYSISDPRSIEISNTRCDLLMIKNTIEE